MEEVEEIIKKEDIEYRKILMFQLNDCRIYQTSVSEDGTIQSNVRKFIDSVNTLRTMLIPYIDDEKDEKGAKKKDEKGFNIKKIQRLDTSAFLHGMTISDIMKQYELVIDTLEKLMIQMHVKNLLLERFAEIEM